ncbi:MAG: phosphatidate cytidylyltransferase [Acidimicrobiales bacterium]
MLPAVGRLPAGTRTPVAPTHGTPTSAGSGTSDILFQFDDANTEPERGVDTRTEDGRRAAKARIQRGDSLGEVVSPAEGSSVSQPDEIDDRQDRVGAADRDQAVDVGERDADARVTPDVSDPDAREIRRREDRPPRSRSSRSTGPTPGPRSTPTPGPRSAPTPGLNGELRRPVSPEDAGSGRNIPLAVASGLVIGIIALVFFKLGNVTSLIIVTAIVTLAAVEAFGAFRKAGYHPATLLGLVATVSLMVATYNRGQQALLLVLVLLVAFTMLWHLAGVDRKADPVLSTGSTLLVFCWIAVFGSFAALLVNPVVFPDRHGIAFLLATVIVGVAYDVGALATGVWIGRRPMAPAVSPRKTWEGFAGGAVAAILVAVVVVHLIHPWTYGAAAALGIVVAIVSPIGDLSESLVKRHLGLKDMGRILPGHGGVLDRVDGLLFLMPATYYLVRAIHLG